MPELDQLKVLLNRIYGETIAPRALERIAALLERFPKHSANRSGFFSQQDVVLITYGDSLIKQGEAPLKTLHDFANRYLKGVISTIHFLPFFPWSSDDGFSVKDFHLIDPDLGSWDDVTASVVYSSLLRCVIGAVASMTILYLSNLNYSETFEAYGS